MTLRNDLLEIRGVGEAKADEILAIIESHESGIDRRKVKKAIYFLENNSTQAARSVLESAIE
jgi:endonuclease III-like uncharacterized protein